MLVTLSGAVDDAVAVDEQEEGKVITVTYAPMNSGNHAATITLSNPGADDKTVTINGTAILETGAGRAPIHIVHVDLKL